MAFQQPTRQLQQRVTRTDSNPPEPLVLAPQVRSGPDESQTWVLFSPVTDTATTTTSTSYLGSVQDDQPTPGRSRISDLGSLETIARSEANSHARNRVEEPNNASDDDTVAEEEDAELDSLDSHLPEFRSVPASYGQQTVSQTAPVLPGHDGLGSFRFNTQGMSVEAQDQLYAFERFNPRRVKRRRESLELGPLDFEIEQAEQELDRNRRIEAWRLEQSQLLLEEIQKETRRRQSEASRHKKLLSVKAVLEDAAPLDTLEDSARDVALHESEWHDQDASDLGDLDEEGVWSRITRKVIRDLMGIDDRLLSILFGEALPDNEGELASTPKASVMNSVDDASSSSWLDPASQLHMLERIARELGLLVHKMSNHPGAFSTYQRVQQMPLPYAGLPAIPEGVLAVPEFFEKKAEESVPSMPEFLPTVAQPVDISGAQSSSEAPVALPRDRDIEFMTASHPPALQTFSQEEWEQDLDIKLVFRYLRSRFISSASSPFPPLASGGGTSHLATSSTQDAAAKAARVRQHHPLVPSHAHAISRPTECRVFKAAATTVGGPSNAAAIRHHHHHAHHRSGSCASQSTRRSARRSSVSSRQSSRHYWDVGGSIGTGSIIASTGPMGSWGEL